MKINQEAGTMVLDKIESKNDWLACNLIGQALIYLRNTRDKSEYTSVTMPATSTLPAEDVSPETKLRHAESLEARLCKDRVSIKAEELPEVVEALELTAIHYEIDLHNILLSQRGTSLAATLEVGALALQIA